MKFSTTFLIGLALILCGTFGVSSAQSLEFNQIRNFDLSITIPGGQSPRNYVTTTNFTVPTGQVLKITSASSGSQSASNTYPFPASTAYELFLDNTQIFGANPGSTPQPVFPIWLPAGTYTFKYHYDSGGSSTQANTYYWKVTGIEFNVVP